ncbi:anthranilate phosphoribosyltransferase [Candidatus Gottesmanbacteria bacterium]|nr:anthranilate phosphoribosyltransferase [Candidatus Gottesmanbacteria bacterium]
MHYLVNKIIGKKDLSLKESMILATYMFQGSLTPVKIASILVALRMKGESSEEILGFITVMRKYMQKIKTSGVVIDTCGTGGDGKGTFNISTATALVVAGAGVKVAKHGNRAASSLCGSADVLEKLGVNIDLTPGEAEECLESVGMTFLFAPNYHPAMKHVSGVRKELGVRTVFNFLGPFVNPAGVRRQIIGVPNIHIARKLAQVAKRLDYKHLLIITSKDGLDEISVFAPSQVLEIKGENIKEIMIDPKKFGFKNLDKKEMRGGDGSYNAEIIKRIIGGEEGVRRDIVVLNTAAALYVAGRVKDIKEGIKLAEESIDSGRAKAILEQFIKYSRQGIKNRN